MTLTLRICCLLLLPSAVSCLRTSCTGRADIVFIVDESGSVGSSDFVKTKSFVKDVVSGFTVGPTAVQFGMITFDDNVRLHFHLNRYTSKSAVMNAVDRVPYDGGGTNTHLALQYAASTGFVASNGARPNAVKMAIVITDGTSSDETATLDKARRLRNMGVSVFAVGVGNIDRAELNAIASDPDSDHVFVVGNANALSGIKQSLQDKVCTVTVTPIHGNWSSWGYWGPCTIGSCSTPSFSTRTRSCTNPRPTNGGRNCLGGSSQRKSCKRADCPPPHWSSWGSWDTCSSTCAGGTRTRSRTCIYPLRPKGQGCSGSSSKSESCNTQRCPAEP